MKKLFLSVSLCALCCGSAVALPFFHRDTPAPTPAPQRVISPEIMMPGQTQTAASQMQSTTQAAPQAAPANATRGPIRGQPRRAANQPAPNAAQTNAQPAQDAPPPRATAEQRTAAKSLPLISQSAFWVGEFEKNNADEEAAFEASKDLRFLGSYQRAIEIAASGIQTSPESGRLWANLGLALLANNQNDPAAQALSKAITLLPNEANLHNGLGITYDRLGRSDLALPIYARALTLLPNDPDILCNYGLSKALNGDLAGAETTLRQAVALPNSAVQARQNLALVVGLQGRLEESERIASQDLAPDVAARNVAYIRAMLNGNENRWNRNPPQEGHTNSGANSHANIQ